ncbi:MAG: hypothetical protein ABWX59_10135, partial [Microbacteriaceae bacterium]
MIFGFEHSARLVVDAMVKEFQEADDRLSDDERRIAEELRWLQEHEQDVALQPVDPITERID